MSRRAAERVGSYALLDALRERRSRRFGLGMAMKEGPLAFRSGQAPLPLDEDEEALLVFAACGLTGPALADLSYARGQGGNIMTGLVGRTVASGDALQAVSLVVSNDQGTWWVRRPQDLDPSDIPEILRLGREGEFTEAYRRMRVPLREGRTRAPMEPLFNLNCNLWSLYPRGSTYFLPVNDSTHIYINGMLEIFNEETGAFVLDERNFFLPAGLGRFARSLGGHLEDDPRKGRVMTVQRLETLVADVVDIEQGMMLQNLGLMTQAAGLGGFPHFAAHDFGWFEALGFRMERMSAGRYLGAGALVRLLLKLLGREFEVPLPVALERDGQPLLQAFCPPCYPSMRDAVMAVVERKFGPQGVFRGRIGQGGWRDPGAVGSAVPPLSEKAVEATIAYCEYIHRRYGRFPAYLPPFRTVLGFQACHVDPEFYDTFYRDGALSQAQRRHLEEWHPKG